MAYTPPRYNAIIFNFTVVYSSVPLYTSIIIDLASPDEATGSIFPTGLDTATFGTASLRLTLQPVFPTGFATEAWGNAHIVANQHVTVTGFAPNVFGTASLQNKNRFITISPGLDTMVFGTTKIDYLDRHIHPSGPFTEHLGAPLVANFIRELNLVSRGIAPGSFGVALVADAVRYIAPPWFYTLAMGLPLVGFNQQVTVSGFATPVMGAPTVKDNHQEVAPPSLTGVVSDGALVALKIRNIFGQGWTEDAGAGQFGPDAEARNTRRVIDAEYIETEWNLGGVSYDTWIHNKNRVVDLIHNGIAQPYLQVGAAVSIRNNAQVVNAAGFEPLVFGQEQCDYKNRTRAAPSIGDTLRMGEFLVVYNRAYQALPGGFAMSVFGLASVVNTRRSFPFQSIPDTSLFGTPFVDFRIRHLAPVPFLQDIGYFGDAFVSYVNRTIAPDGFQYTPFGAPAFDIHFNIVRPNSVGDTMIFDGANLPRVQNVTPEIGPYWDSSLFTLFGATAIFNRNNYLPVHGFANPTFGALFIDYRTKHLLLSGFDAMRIPTTHVVRNQIPDPPTTQRIDLDDPPGLGFGINMLAFGGATLTANSIYPAGFDAGFYGQPRVKINGIFPIGITPPYDPDGNGTEFGVAVLNPTQFIEAQGDFFTEVFAEYPRLNPLTIWAPAGAPENATPGNPGHDQLMDFIYFGALGLSSMPVFGTPIVTLKNRTFSVSSLPLDSAQVGFPSLTTNPQFVSPDGLRTQKFGFPVFPGRQPVRPPSIPPAEDLLGDPIEPATFGDLTLVNVGGTWRPSPPGMVSEAWGNTTVANFIRYYAPAGIDSLVFGQTKVQRPPPPAKPAGQDFLTFGGETFIDYRIRTRAVQGFDSFTMDYTPGQFAERLRVTGQGGVLPVGIDDGDIGAPTVGNSSRALAAQGIAPSSFGDAKLRKQSIVALAGAGFDAAVFGAPFYVGALDGHLRPQGSDFEVFGDAHLKRPLAAIGLGDQEAFGNPPRVAHSLGAGSWEAAEYGGAVVMGFGCGRQARAILGFESELYGTPGIIFAPPPGEHAAIGWDSLIFGTGKNGDTHVRGRKTITGAGISGIGSGLAFGSANVHRPIGSGGKG